MSLQYQPLLKAIEAYLAKVDEDLEEDLEDEGRVMPNETVSSMNVIEEGVTAALLAETAFFIKEIKKKKTLSELIDTIDEIKAKDIYCNDIAKVVSEQFHKIIPPLVREYVSVVDNEIKIADISKRTFHWIDEWSEQLSRIMKLTSHTQLDEILKQGLETGKDISDVTLAIKNSGIRNEYYRARTTAVTEIMRAHNVAKQEAAMQNPAVKEKLWRHTGAHKNMPRENHVAMDGQRVPVDMPFTLVGADGDTYYPMYPVDSSLPPRESINCHCIAQDIIDEEILAMSLEERQALQEKIIAEMDEDWERELDEKNRAKAGIE